MAESIRIVCPKCKTVHRLPPDVRPGAKVRCGKCGTKTLVPQPKPAQPPIGQAGLAGSPDDRQVSLAPAASDASTLTRKDDATEEAIETLLRECGVASGRYVEQGLVGRGGMGEIALCVDRNIRRQIAMKRMLPATATNPARRARFVEEAQVTGQLEHPNIVPVHELERTPDGTIYFTMKLVKGRSIADILRDLKNPPGDLKERVTLGELLQIFLKVCDGVGFAHSRGVVHRDLKPSNIMVGDFGEVLVMDWGLAKIVGREDIGAEELVVSSRLEKGQMLTMDGSAMGTPAYMPPEQAEGQLDKIDHRSDIYSLGAILYEMLALERAVKGDTSVAVLMNVIEGKIVPPEERAPARHIPRELSAVAMKCLSKNRLHRYQSATELHRDITLFLEGRSVSAAPDTFPQAVVKLVKRNKAVSASMAAAAVIILVLTTGFIVSLAEQRNRARASEKRAVAARQKQHATALAASEALAKQAIRAAEGGRLAEADVRADAALNVMPDGPWGHYALGVVAFEKKDLAAARKHLEEAVGLDRSHEPSSVFLSRVLAASGELVKWEKLVAGSGQSSDWRSLVAAADALMSAKRYKQAHKAYRRALGLMERDATIPPNVRLDVRSKAGGAEACIKTQGFYQSIRHLLPQEQVRRIEAKLKEIYGAALKVRVTTWTGVLTTIDIADNGELVQWLDPLRGMPLTRLVCDRTHVRDLTPLKGMPLKELYCYSTYVSDLGPVRGMPLALLHCGATPVSDLRPLEGMPLRTLHLRNGGVSDLRPLRGMPLAFLDVAGTRVVDLAPLAGMPLERLFISETRVTDLTPLKGMPLTHLRLFNTRVADLSPLKGMPLETLRLQGSKVTDLTPLAGMKLKELRLPPRKQLTPESMKLIETLEKQGCKVVWEK